jgi:hypothetical protein
VTSIRVLVPHVDREVALGIEVNKEDALPELGQRAPEIHRGRRLANPTFLVGNGDHSAQAGVRLLRTVVVAN